MKYAILLILLVAISNLYPNKPFALWQLSDNLKLQFEEEECQYSITSDKFKKDWKYDNTDILTDELGSKLFSFDKYANKIVIRDQSDNIVLEHYFDNQNATTNTEAIIIPFYAENIYYYVYIASLNDNEVGSLNYIKIDNSAGVVTLKTETLIESAMSRNLLSATISDDGNSYYIATIKTDPNLLHITRLFADERIEKKIHFELDTLKGQTIFAGKKIKFSPQGDKLILNHYGSEFRFYSFDNTNGNVVKEFDVDFNEETNFNVRSMFEFSQDGKKLYSQSGHDNYIIHQFDLNNWGDKNYFLNSIETVWSTKSSCVDCLFRDFQLAPNNRIYISYLHSYTGRKDSSFIGVINCPNSEAPYVGYQHLGIPLTDEIITISHLQNIPTNFLAEPQPPTEFIQLPDTIELCKGNNAVIEGIDDPCGEHRWLKLGSGRIYSQDLNFESITDEDAGTYFYHFNNCNQFFNDTFEIKVIEKLEPEIVLISPDELNLCKTPLDEMRFTTKEHYDDFNWYITNPNTNTKDFVGDTDTIIVSELGVLSVEVGTNNGCNGIAEYDIEIPNFEYDDSLSFDFDVCKGIEEYLPISFPIKSDASLRIDSLNLLLSDKIVIMNDQSLVGIYSDGNFDKDIILYYDASAEGTIIDTIEVFTHSNCDKIIRIPIKINILSNSFAIEIPHLRTQIGILEFEIPIFFTVACLEDIDFFNFEGTISLSKHKYFIERVEGVNVVDSWDDNINTNIKIEYSDNQLVMGEKKQIGTIIGTVLLTTQDSTSILLSDTTSNYPFNIVNGSLVTKEICIQDLRQVHIIDDELGPININNNKIEINFNGNYRGNYDIELLDYMGRIAKSSNFKKHRNDYSYQLNLNGISNGLYFLRVNNGLKNNIFKIFIE